MSVAAEVQAKQERGPQYLCGGPVDPVLLIANKNKSIRLRTGPRTN